MAELPIMPVNVHALIADTSHMTTEEFGAYCRLLFTMWAHGGTLPNDMEELARIAGVSRTRWNHIAARVLRPMTATEQILSQKRLVSTWLEVQELRAKRADNARKRWNKRTAH